MERVLLDTQVLFLAYEDGIGNLPKRARVALEDPDTERMISSASIMEISIKHAIGKLDMDEQTTGKAIRDMRLSVVPFHARHAYQMFLLPLHHRDPFDRMILATAIRDKVAIISGDRVFGSYEGVEIVW